MSESPQHSEDGSPQAATPLAPPRQTAAYLKKWFGEVGFTVDARRGQNFLIDLNLLDLLVRAAGIRPDDVVLEVGAGSGTLTTRGGLNICADTERDTDFEFQGALIAPTYLHKYGYNTMTLSGGGYIDYSSGSPYDLHIRGGGLTLDNTTTNLNNRLRGPHIWLNPSGSDMTAEK